MHTPIGPSLYLALVAADAFGTLTASMLKAIWDRYLSYDRFERRLQRFEQRGILQTSDASNLDRVLALTDLGRALACGGRDPISWWERDWDMLWRLAAYDVPESQASRRRRLRQQLVGLGFGCLQGSVLISPDPVDALRRRLHDLRPDAGALVFFEARPAGGESDAEIVQAAWDFPRLNQRYENYFTVLRDRPRFYEGGAWERWLQVECRAWQHATRGDPFLPRVLLPPQYLGCDAYHERQAVMRSLLEW